MKCTNIQLHDLYWHHLLLMIEVPVCICERILLGIQLNHNLLLYDDINCSDLSHTCSAERLYADIVDVLQTAGNFLTEQKAKYGTELSIFALKQIINYYRILQTQAMCTCVT